MKAWLNPRMITDLRENKVKSPIVEYDVGTDFDLDVLSALVEMNETSQHARIAEVYGSLQTSVLDLPSARPDFRLSACTMRDFERYVDLAQRNGITVSYAVNAPFTSSINDYHECVDEVVGLLKYLESVGITCIIVSNPLLMEIASECTDLRLKVSTIQGVNRASSIKYYAAYNVDRICPDIYVNRNTGLLRSMSDEAKRHGIELELLANEICLFGDTPCSNMLRAACYAHSSLGGNPDALFDNWPFARCQAERKKNPICWLKIPYILPQYVGFYREQTGISHFKISGRTNTHEYLLKTVRCYMEMSFEGKIQELFMLPSNRSDGDVDVTAEQLISSGFFDKLYGSRACDYKCESCRLCDEYGRSFGLTTA